MNSIIETLNLWGGQALGFAWPMLWQSSLLIAVLFALDFALRRKVRAAVRYALWLVVLVKLLLPPSLALPTGIGWWLRPTTVTPAERQTTSVVASEVATLAPSLPVPEPMSFTPPPRVPMSASAWTLIAWCVASIGLLVWLVLRWWQVARDVRRAGPVPESVNEPLSEARRLAGVRHSVRLRLTDRAMSPAVCGLFRPVILLPHALTEQLAPAQLRAVLLHELTHLRRGDVWVNCAQALLQIVYWWHPLLWLANARIRRVREEAVDDAVMLALREDAETYAPTLLEVAKLAFNRRLASLGLVGILESRSALRQRIERLVDFRAPRRAGLSLMSLMGISAFAALAAPMGEAPQRPPSDAKSDSVPLYTRTFKLDPDTFYQGLKEASFLGSGTTNATSGGESAGDQHQLRGAIVTRVQAAPSQEQGDHGSGKGRDRFITQTNSVEEISVAARNFFTSLGVNLVAPKSVFFHDRQGLLLVRATLQDLDLIEGAIQVMGAVPPQTDKAVSPPQAASGAPASEQAIRLRTVSPQKIEASNQVQDGKLLWELGRFKEAEAKLKAVLETDPENRAAYYYLSLVNNSLAGKSTPPSGRQRIIGKLNRIRLASVAYDGLQLDEVVRRLSDEVKRLDPEMEGINFLILTNLSTVRIEIKPALTDIRLADALKAIVKGADKPINYSVEDYAIIFQAKTEEPLGLETRTYKIDTNAFFASVRKQAGLAETNSLGEYSQAIRKLLTDAGVDLKAPKTVFINEGKGLLLVRATPADLDQVEELLLKLNSPSPQINIKARFIEMPEQVERSLLTDMHSWNPFATNNQSFVISASQMKALREKMVAQEGVDVLAAPEVTTLSGRQAQMKSVEIKSVATEINPQSLGKPVLTPTDVTSTNLEFGEILDVVPALLSDGVTIALNVEAKRTEFLGYAEPTSRTSNGLNGKTESSPQPLSPRVRSRRMSQEASLKDGETLVLCIPAKTQFITSEVFKYPVDNAESKAVHRAESKPLFVFVTATLVDPAGKPIHEANAAARDRE